MSEFVRRHGVAAAALVLGFILLYKLGDAFAGVMANPFYVAGGFTKAEIASVTKVFGLVATLLGVFLGGVVVSRHGVSERAPGRAACSKRSPTSCSPSRPWSVTTSASWR